MKKLSGNYINKLLTSGIKKDKKYNYKIVDKWKSIVKNNNCKVEKLSKFHLTKSNNTDSEKLLLDLKENGTLKKELLLSLLVNKLMVKEKECTRLAISRNEAYFLFENITRMKYSDYNKCSEHDKCVIIVTNLLKYVNSITLTKYFTDIGHDSLCSVEMCFKEIKKKVRYNEVICERDFLLLTLAIYIESLKLLDVSFVYQYYNVYFDKCENSCDIELSDESKLEFSRAIMMYEKIKSGEITNLYVNYEIMNLNKVFGDGYFFTAYVISKIGDDFNDYRYKYIFERFISSCILNDLDYIDDMEIKISSEICLSSHITDVSINCKGSYRVDDVISLKKNREFLLRGSLVVSEFYFDVAVLIESGVPFCVFAIYRCRHNYPNVKFILNPLYKSCSIKDDNIVTNCLSIDYPILGGEDENGNFIHLFFSREFYAENIVQKI